MTFRSFLAGLIVSITACDFSLGNEERSIGSETPVIAIYDDNIQMINGGIDLVVALWPDGFCLWSESPHGNAKSWRCAQLPKESFPRIVDALDDEGFFDEEELGDQKVGPGTSSTVILVNGGNKKLHMESWHEQFERNGLTIMNARGGITPLYNAKRISALKHQPASALFYRLSWLELKSKILGIRPTLSKEIAGRIEWGNGKILFIPER